MEESWRFKFKTDTFEHRENGVLLSAQRILGEKIGSEVYSFCVKSADCGALQAEARYFLPVGRTDFFSAITGFDISKYSGTIERIGLSETMREGLREMFEKINGAGNS